MSIAPPPRHYVIETMPDLARAVQARRLALGMSQLEVDERAGLASGYTAKVEMFGNGSTATNARAIGRESLPLLLGALGVRLVLTPVRELRVRDPVPPKLSGGRGGRARAEKLAPERRREIARAAARARWAALPRSLPQQTSCDDLLP